MLAINFTDQEKDKAKNIRIGAFLTFAGVISRFIVGDIIKPHSSFNYHCKEGRSTVTLTEQATLYLFWTSLKHQG